MIESILDSKTKMKIAKLFAERNGPFQVSDVGRVLKISKSRASECMRELAEKGVLERQSVGRSVLYKLSSSNLAKTISTILTQEKILLAELEKTVTNEVKQLKPVSIALFGSALKGLKAGSDVDFLFLYEGNLEKEKIYEIAAMLTEKFGFHVSILPMRIGVFKTKSRRGEEFVLNAIASHKLLYGKKLEDLIW